MRNLFVMFVTPVCFLFLLTAEYLVFLVHNLENVLKQEQQQQISILWAGMESYRSPSPWIKQGICFLILYHRQYSVFTFHGRMILFAVSFSKLFHPSLDPCPFYPELGYLTLESKTIERWSSLRGSPLSHTRERRRAKRSGGKLESGEEAPRKFLFSRLVLQREPARRRDDRIVTPPPSPTPWKSTLFSMPFPISPVPPNKALFKGR